MYVVDATDPDRFDEAREVLHKLLQTAELADIPLLVYANKQDAPGACTARDLQERLGLRVEGSGSSQPISVCAVSALSGAGINDSVQWLVEALKSSPRAIAMQGSASNRG